MEEKCFAVLPTESFESAKYYGKKPYPHMRRNELAKKTNLTNDERLNFQNNNGNTKNFNISLSRTIGKSYLVATGGAVTTALALNRMVKNAPAIVGRFVPFAAVAAANCVNIPAMRSKELTEGIKVFDDNNNSLGLSKVAAQEATIAVVISRIIMAAPGMTITPVVMNSMDRRGMFAGRRWLEPVLQVLFTGVVLTFATPLACALFVQQVPVSPEKLETDIQEAAKKIKPPPTMLYYNKGL